MQRGIQMGRFFVYGDALEVMESYYRYLTGGQNMSQPIEYTGKQLAKIAGKGLRDPQSLSSFEIRALAGCALTQARNTKSVLLTRPPRGSKNWKAEIA